MKLYGGIDLHSNNNVVAIVDEDDGVVYRKRLPNDLDTILKRLSPYRSALQGLVMESTYNWYFSATMARPARECTSRRIST